MAPLAPPGYAYALHHLSILNYRIRSISEIRFHSRAHIKFRQSNSSAKISANWIKAERWHYLQNCSRAKTDEFKQKVPS